MNFKEMMVKKFKDSKKKSEKVKDKKKKC